MAHKKAGGSSRNRRNHTLFALTDGIVRFEVKGAKNRKMVRIEPLSA